MQAHTLGGLNVDVCFFGETNLKKVKKKPTETPIKSLHKRRNTSGPTAKGPIHIDKKISRDE